MILFCCSPTILENSHIGRILKRRPHVGLGDTFMSFFFYIHDNNLIISLNNRTSLFPWAD